MLRRYMKEQELRGGTQVKYEIRVDLIKVFSWPRLFFTWFSLSHLLAIT